MKFPTLKDPELIDPFWPPAKIPDTHKHPPKKNHHRHSPINSQKKSNETINEYQNSLQNPLKTKIDKDSLKSRHDPNKTPETEKSKNPDSNPPIPLNLNAS